jgi:hypothetical protein
MKGHGLTREARQRQLAALNKVRGRALASTKAGKVALTRRLNKAVVSLPKINLPEEK